MELALYPKYLIRSLFVHDRHSFFKAGYAVLYPEYSRHGMTPWQHYVVDGKRKGFNDGNTPSERVFFREGYELEYPDVKSAGVDSWRHYAEKGKKEGRDNGMHPSEDQFFREGYLEMYPDVAQAKVDPWRHYVLQGKRSGMDNGAHPNAKLFSGKGYLERYQDVALAKVDPWRHYIFYGKKEGRDNGLHYESDYEIIKNSCYFDSVFYKNTYADLFRHKDLDPVRHYLCYGYTENRNPSANFNTSEYVQFFKLNRFVNPLVHYEKEGKYYDCSGLVEVLCDNI